MTQNLRIPGPTTLPDPVREALSGQMIDHRGPEFAILIGEVTTGLQEALQTHNDVLLLTASGTAGMETAIVNTLSPGDRVLALVNGAFGQRFANIAAAFGADVKRIEFAWGSPVDPDVVAKALRADGTIKAVLVVHNETSTGIANDLEAIARMVKDADKLLLVDAISSAGAMEIQTDAWGIDVVITGSQKAWMSPPGIAMIAFSPAAWKANETARMPRFYLDLLTAKKSLEKGQTPYTPAVSVLYALRVALSMMRQEGFANVIARHERVATYTRSGVQKLGLALFVNDVRHASPTVTAIAVPEGIDPKQLRRMMREEHDVVIAGGQAALAEKIVRIGHLGAVAEADIDGTLAAMSAALTKLGFKK